MSVYVPSHLPERMTVINQESSKCLLPETSKQEIGIRSLNFEEPAVLPKSNLGYFNDLGFGYKDCLIKGKHVPDPAYE
ncbi:hypothetical protein ACSBR1_008588 [Camellia fascicularis]